MDSFLPFLCLMLGLALPLVALGMLVSRAVRQDVSAAAYRTVARELGFQADTRGISLRGLLGERRLWIGEILEGHGVERQRVARAHLSLTRPLGLGAYVRQRGRSDRLLERFRRRGAPVQVGDDLVRAHLDVRGDHPEQMKALLSGPVLPVLLAALDEWPGVVLTDHHVHIRLRNSLTSPRRLRHLVHTLCAIADAAEASRREIEPPDSLLDVRDAWRALATAEALTLEPSLPALSGTLAGMRVVVAARRDDRGYCAEVRVHFAAPATEGLRVFPKVPLESSWNPGQDIHVGKPDFDGTFLVKGFDPSAVRALLTEEIQADMLGLAEHSEVHIDDGGLTLHPVAVDAKTVAETLHRAVRVARRLVGSP